MGLGESIRLAFEGLRANKMRAVLTMLGIIIGIAAVIGILTVGDGLSGYINSTMSDLGASSIIVTLQEKDREAVSSEDMMSMMVMKQPETTDLMTRADLLPRVCRSLPAAARRRTEDYTPTSPPWASTKGISRSTMSN